MRISAFTTITDPEKRQDPWVESIKSWMQVADEIVIVDGSKKTIDQKYTPEQLIGDMFGHGPVNKDNYWLKDNFHIVKRPWPDEWSWDQLPRQFNAGLKVCTGDWVIRFDADWIIDTADAKILRKRLENAPVCLAASMQKFCTVTADKVYQKGPQPIIINNNFKKIAFGRDLKKPSDLCYPIVVSDPNGGMVPTGTLIGDQDTFKTGVPFYNYDYCFKTKEVTQKEFWRFARAYHRYFGEWKFGDSEQKSFEVFIKMMQGRLKKCVYFAGYDDKQGLKNYIKHPSLIHKKLKSMKKNQFGFDGWGLL